MSSFPRRVSCMRFEETMHGSRPIVRHALSSVINLDLSIRSQIRNQLIDTTQTRGNRGQYAEHLKKKLIFSLKPIKLIVFCILPGVINLENDRRILAMSNIC